MDVDPEQAAAEGLPTEDDVRVTETPSTAPVGRRRAMRRSTVPEGTRIGRYQVLATLGSGGMGVVYKAHDPELDRPVALKLVRVRRDERRKLADARARLLREAKALAQLSHPNVVAVHDVGSIDDDVFIAMEFVEGTTLRRWLRDAPRTPREILDVFRAAGAGLAAAHRAGIVHRDFKPENVILGADGRVRVLDFGLARSLDALVESADPMATPEAAHEEVHVSSRLTRTGLVTGTPAYMAPEQHLRGEIDGRADEFAFCVALHEALYKRRPFAGDTVDQLRAAVVAGKLPPPPARAGVPARVRRAIARGLSRHAEDRFPSMEPLLAQLAERRGWVVAALVSSLAVATVAALALALGLGRHAAAEPCAGVDDRLAGVWDDAVRARVQAAFAASGRAYADETFAHVAAALDQRAASWQDMRREVCMATRVRADQSEALMDLRVQCLERRRAAMGALTALFASHVDGDAVDHAIEATLDLPGLDGCADAAALEAAFPPPDDAAQRADVDRVRAALDAVVAEEAAGQYRAGLATVVPLQAESARIGWPPLDAQALFWLAMLQSRTDDADHAAASFERAMKRAAVARDDALLVSAGIERVYVLGYQLAHGDQALQLSEVLDVLVTRNGDDPGTRGRLLDRTGVVRWSKGDYAAAQADFERALPLYLHALGPDHPRVAALHTNLGNVFADQGRSAEARQQYEEELAILRRSVGDRHPDVARSLANLGTVLESEHDYAGAQADFERALDLWETAYGKIDLMVAMASNNLGDVLDKEGDHARALTYCQRAVAIGEQLLPPDHPIRAYHLLCEGDALVGLGRASEAIAPLERALAIRTQAGGDPTDLAEVQLALARALWDGGGDRARALTLARAARDADAAAGDRKHDERADADAWLAAHRAPR